jgi:hypothetical protein
VSNIKHKQTVYLVIREDDEVCCAVTRTEERAQELCGQYEQQYRDHAHATFNFYVMGQTFYDE